MTPIENYDPLAPARGLRNAILIALPLWAVVGWVYWDVIRGLWRALATY